MAQWHSAETNVYNAAAPVAWTDLDLSAVVGTQRVLVALKVQIVTSGRYVSFRTNGDAGDFRGFFAGGHGVHTAYHPVIDGSYRSSLLVVETDENGIVEFISNAASNVIIDVQGWASTLHSGAQVYDAAPPAAWTLLDLSAVVGAQPAVALLRVEEDNGALQGLGVRRAGTSYETVPPFSVGTGAAFAEIAANAAVYLLVDTSNNGEIEIIRFNAGAGNLVITVEAFATAAAGWNIPTAGEEEVYNAALPGAWVQLDLTQSTTPAATGLPADEVLALMYAHDMVGGQEFWHVRPDLDADNWDNVGSGSTGASATLIQAGANLAGLLAMETDVGAIDHDSQFGRVGEVTLAGWIDPFDGHAPSISMRYPAPEQIVDQNAVIRFRLSDTSGINISTLNVTLSCVDDRRPLIVNGAWGVKDGVTQAWGQMTANPTVYGYDISIHPVAELPDRRWRVTVEVENSDGVGLP